MRKRQGKRLYWADSLQPYGATRSTGSRKLRRGRRTLLARNPFCRDRSSMPARDRIACLRRWLDRMHLKYGRPEVPKPDTAMAELTDQLSQRLTADLEAKVMDGWVDQGGQTCSA